MKRLQAAIQNAENCKGATVFGYYVDNPNFLFVKADIYDREAVNKLFEEEYPDIMVKFAAESHVNRSIENSEFSSRLISLAPVC